jgi:hypothetical protein
MFGPLPDYAQDDNFELFMFYAVPALITAVGLGFAFFALRSGRSSAGVHRRLCHAGRMGSMGPGCRQFTMAVQLSC